MAVSLFVLPHPRGLCAASSTISRGSRFENGTAQCQGIGVSPMRASCLRREGQRGELQCGRRGDLEQRHPRRQGRCLDADRRCRIWLPETTTPRTPLNTYDQRTASSLRRPTVTSPHSGPMALVLAEAQLQAQEVVEDAWDLHRRRCALGVRRDRASLCVCGYRLFVWCGHRLSVCGYRLIV